MPVKKFLMGREGSNPSRPPLHIVHRVALDSDRRSPFLHGMTRAVDVGGCLRQTNAEAARRLSRELIAELASPDVDVVIIGGDWDAVGQDFRFVAGTAVSQGTLAETTYE